jgi:anti-anti-sigma factor
VTAFSAPPFERIWVPDSLTVTVLRSEHTRAWLRAVGALDMTGTRVLCDVLAQQRELGRRYVRIDLSDIAFLDSAGMHALAVEHASFLRRRGTLIISGLSDRARRLLRIVGLDRELFLLEPFAEVTAGELAATR